MRSPRSGRAVLLFPFAVLVLLLAILPSCGDPEEPPPKRVLRINQIQVRGTHNSYHLGPSRPITREWAYTHRPLDEQLGTYGIRQFELDVHYRQGKGFLVYHVPGLDDGTTCETLVKCLSIMKTWSDANPMHHVLFVLVEPKDDVDPEPIDGHYAELDQAILSVWPKNRIVTPDDVRGTHATLRAGVLAGGWPGVDESRGKVLFAMLDGGKHKKNYLAQTPNLVGRPMFVKSNRDEPVAAIMLRDGPLDSGEEIRSLVREGFIVRTRADSPNPDELDPNSPRPQAALASGAQLISTDYPYLPAMNGYRFELPTGPRSRCNPINAPEWCTTDLVEPPLTGTSATKKISAGR